MKPIVLSSQKTVDYEIEFVICFFEKGLKKIDLREDGKITTDRVSPNG